MGTKVFGEALAEVAYEMAVSSTGEKDNETPKIVYPNRGLTPVLGTMDCQGFVEECLRECGYSRNWSGSNAMWRDMEWRGTPEECKKAFGKIPVGAWLYIWTEDMSSAPAKYHSDGQGNATHVGIYTGMGKGAAHSSASRKGVCQSAFSGKTVKNGGWNRVGLPSFMDYDMTVSENTGTESGTGTFEAYTGTVNTDKVRFRTKPNTKCSWYCYLNTGDAVTVQAHVNDTWDKVTFSGKTGYVMSKFIDQKEAYPILKKVYAANGSPVKVRSKPSTGSKWAEQLKVGTVVQVDSEEDGWSKIRYGSREGYMMSQYLTDVMDTLEG